ncbi:hypothetical protein PHLGIDRAFT_116091 [Phlebiopsis gigantea 11061_1 CR5-6]|uniref:Glycopeptide n=1 Tax=Phlebiopsis gigantea (strain 11061_1 CR5-6) TaxID=745531 RepID=A0A0C3SDL8_PHLG1|nr:hypothetical protein PHLGIDRAFT_116091 [Phlebiopsis gigantea 11061_1 CR5-6]
MEQPVLKANGKTLASGKDTTINGPLIAAISFLQDGKCGANGERCTLVETTLKDPTPGQPGSGSSTDISLIPPLKFSETASFKYTNAGCKGEGKTCTKPDCKDAFHKPDDTHVQVACQGKNVGLEISFC